MKIAEEELEYVCVLSHGNKLNLDTFYNSVAAQDHIKNPQEL
ncbi:hypothetical protein HJ01_00630 [Flavobacterium frigoris PS1]|uniref:Uncharacterized protein n=1 Tax=Flavobacterium frigoris (strain PS1) TaxID=1086011 RepID=H7FNF9_FLAFP|nr:hypothetical protein HJ01_00630 [Flavobacterium frigoris PS1]